MSKKWAKKRWYNVILDAIGYLFAFATISVAVMAIRYGGLSYGRQCALAIVLLVFAFVLELIRSELQLWRNTHHDNRSSRDSAQDIGFMEQKCFQITIITVIVVVMLPIDMHWSLLAGPAEVILPKIASLIP